MDLFETPEKLPQKVKDIIDNFAFDNITCAEFVKQLNEVGYTCQYGLDNIPYNLTKVNNNTMLVRKFEKLVSDIIGQRVELYELLDQNAKKWYEQKFNKCTGDAVIRLDYIYGVSLDGSSIIDFNFKVGKTIESVLKTFITQYTTKVSAYDFVDGVHTELTKEQKLKKIIDKNKDRVYFGLFYTTLYGIGLWDFFNSKEVHKTLTDKMNKFLESEKITYKNEYSDAGWVYRYRFNLSIEKTNELLKKFETITK